MGERYLKKLEIFEDEREFIESHKISDDVTKRTMLYSLQVCVGTAMDIAAMKIKDSGMVVEDDYSNIGKLVENEIITLGEGETLKKFNGMKNAIVHKYDRLDLKIIEAAFSKIDEFSEVVLKISG